MPTPERANLETLSDLCTPWCIRVVATLRIADHIAAGTTEINSLAAAAGCHSDSLRAVLGHLVSKGVFLETEPGRFVLNEAAQGLRDPSQRLGLDLESIGGRFAYGWGTLLTYVRTGAPAYHELFRLPFWHAGRSSKDGGSFRRHVPVRRRGGACDDRWAELLRSASGRCRPVSLARRAERLARSRSHGDLAPLCRRGAPERSSGDPQRRGAGRRATSAGDRDGVSRWEAPYGRPVPRART